MRIFVSGSLAHDVIMEFPGSFKDHILPDKIHMLNVSFLVDGLRINYGGTAGNIAYNLALLGEDPIVLSAVGRDFDRYKAWLQENDVDVSCINVLPDEQTAAAHIITDAENNQITAFHPGAMRYACGAIREDMLSGDTFAVVAPGYKEDMLVYPELYRERGIPFIFDPGQQTSALSGDEFKRGMRGAKIFISNDYEWEMMLQKTGMEEKDVLRLVEIIVITLGEQGSRIITGTERYDIPPVSGLDVKDPTGAGDAYRAGLIKGLQMGFSLEKAGRLASVVAAYVVEEHGTQVHHFTLEAVYERYRKAYGHSIMETVSKNK